MNTIPDTKSYIPQSAETFDPPIDMRSRLGRMLLDRLRKCVMLLPKVLSGDDPDAVHDLRVWSRRSQQVIVALFPQPLPAEARAMMKVLRRARHSLGAWRDCDVLIALLERKARRIRGADERQAWEMVGALGRKKRQRQMHRARHKLANRKLLMLVQRGQKVLERRAAPNAERDQGSIRAFLSTVAAGYATWREGLARAHSSSTAAEIHAFRIQTKRLRYRIELARDLGFGSAEQALACLKAIQDQLGYWHDSAELALLAAEALANPQFLVEHPRTAAAVLRKIDHNSAVQIRRVRRLLESTRAGLEFSPIHTWVRACCEREPGQPGEKTRAAARESRHDAPVVTAPEEAMTRRV